MPGVAWMAHSFFNSSTGAVWPLNVTTPLPDRVARLARHAYFASVSWLDHQIGRILDELDELDIAEQTIVVLRNPLQTPRPPTPPPNTRLWSAQHHVQLM